MKSLIAFFIMASSMAAHADLNLQCDVVKLINDNVFEEGLGETGNSEVDGNAQNVSIQIRQPYQDMSIRQSYQAYQEISIGHHAFTSNDEETKISVKESNDATTYTADVDQSQSVKIKVYKKSLLGVVLQKDDGEKSYKTVATIDCNDHSKIKALILSNKVVFIEAVNIPKAILKKVATNVSVAFEYGDGYYDIQSEKLMEVAFEGKLIGYVLETNMSYTEGDDVTVYTYFMANGVRFAGPE
jgi:hypothetical protein